MSQKNKNAILVFVKFNKGEKKVMSKVPEYQICSTCGPDVDECEHFAPEDGKRESSLCDTCKYAHLIEGGYAYMSGWGEVQQRYCGYKWEDGVGRAINFGGPHNFCVGYNKK
jgi:hypothetical protein